MIIATARDAADILVPLFSTTKREKIVVMHLDSAQQLIKTVESANEGQGEIKLPVQIIFSDALRLGTSGLIIAHNYLNGNVMPSASDLAAVREFSTVAMSLGIQLHDHLIVENGGDCRSLRTLGLL